MERLEVAKELLLDYHPWVRKFLAEGAIVFGGGVAAALEAQGEKGYLDSYFRDRDGDIDVIIGRRTLEDAVLLLLSVVGVENATSIQSVNVENYGVSFFAHYHVKSLDGRVTFDVTVTDSHRVDFSTINARYSVENIGLFCVSPIDQGRTSASDDEGLPAVDHRSPSVEMRLLYPSSNCDNIGEAIVHLDQKLLRVVERKAGERYHASAVRFVNRTLKKLNRGFTLDLEDNKTKVVLAERIHKADQMTGLSHVFQVTTKHDPRLVELVTALSNDKTFATPTILKLSTSIYGAKKDDESKLRAAISDAEILAYCTRDTEEVLPARLGNDATSQEREKWWEHRDATKERLRAENTVNRELLELASENDLVGYSTLTDRLFEAHGAAWIERLTYDYHQGGTTIFSAYHEYYSLHGQKLPSLPFLDKLHLNGFKFLLSTVKGMILLGDEPVWEYLIGQTVLVEDDEDKVYDKKVWKELVVDGALFVKLLKKSRRFNPALITWVDRRLLSVDHRFLSADHRFHSVDTRLGHMCLYDAIKICESITLPDLDFALALLSGKSDSGQEVWGITHTVVLSKQLDAMAKYTDYLVKGLTLPEATVKMRAIKCFFRGIRTRGGSTPLDKYLVDHASSHVDVISYLSTRFPGYFTKTENAIVNTIAGL